MIIIGTTISLVLTISASVALELNERANDRRLSALMVMGTIEDFANGIEEQAPVIDDFYTPHLKPESLLRPYDS